mmetsp:Transcript_29139/g.67060  ORF Transcript_29139/g.67060 Transcript_29139/m.67060 type:complete len:522 (-) Transcript_29139:71-1636(-)
MLSRSALTRVQPSRLLYVRNLTTKHQPTGPLAGLKVLDLSRILAGPSATMLMGDMGATIIKVERPKAGDDTRRYAPPYLQKTDGVDSEIAAYFSSCNRNKFSVALNFTTKEGQAIIKRLLSQADVVVENFKTGTLDKYGLGPDQVAKDFPNVVYCSITGFGHTGPYKERPAYDMLIQAMGGSMSITGVPEGEPMKMGLSMFDLTAGLHAVIGILSALRNKEATGLGQHVDIAMLDVSVALLQNQGMNFLAKKERQKRVGNNHPNVVPYQVMPASDGHFILTASNDEQFEKFCKVAGKDDLMQDERFNTMKARVVNRPHVTPALNEITKTRPTNWWLRKLEAAGVGVAPILHPDEVFADPQVLSRGMLIEMQPPGCEKPVSLIGSPMKFSRTPVNYRIPPVRVGEHTDPVLLASGFTQAEIDEYRSKGAVGEMPPPMEISEEAYVVDPQGNQIPGKTWSDMRSVSVPVAGAYVDPPKDSAPKAKPDGMPMVGGAQISGRTWEALKSVSVPSASAAFMGKDQK